MATDSYNAVRIMLSVNNNDILQVVVIYITDLCLLDRKHIIKHLLIG